MTKLICIRIRSLTRRTRISHDFCSRRAINLRPCDITFRAFVVTMRPYCIRSLENKAQLRMRWVSLRSHNSVTELRPSELCSVVRSLTTNVLHKSQILQHCTFPPKLRCIPFGTYFTYNCAA